MRKIYILIFAISLIVSGCAQESTNVTKEDNEIIESSSTKLFMESYECPIDTQSDMYIDSVNLEDKFQILLLSMESGNFVLKRQIMERDGEWKEDVQKLDKSIADYIGNTEGKSSYFTKIHKESEDTLYALWQQYEIVEDEEDDSLTRVYTKFGIAEIDADSWKVKMLWTNAMGEKDVNSGVTDFGITDVGDFMLYFGQTQKVVKYNIFGEARDEFDMKNIFCGVAQFNEGDIWVLSQESKELLRYNYLNGKIEKMSSTPCESDENAQTWKVFGQSDETLYFCKDYQLYIVEESKGLKEVEVNMEIPVTFSDYVNSEVDHVCYLLGAKISGEEETENNGNCLQVYVINES